MKTGMCIYSDMSIEEQVECFVKYGVNRTFIGSEDENFEKKIALFKENDIVCETLHAPFRGINAMWGKDEEDGIKMLDRLKDCIDKCEKHNIPVAIVHLSSGCPMPEINETGLRRYEELFSYADKKGVKIALENQRYLEILDFFMKRYENIGFCWDCGHEYGFTKGIRFMELFGDRAIALHIHDNSCGMNTDDHLIPFDGNINFDTVAKNIADSGYGGTLMLELLKNTNYLGTAIYENVENDEYVRRACDAVNRLSEMVENYRR